MRFVKRAENLIYTDMQQVNINFEMPFIIDTQNKVYFGNSIKNKHNIFIVINIDDFAFECFNEIEKAMADENNVQRYYNMKIELQKYIKKYLQPVTENMFDVRETRSIEETYYDEPKTYSFEKKHRKEAIYNEDLFSRFGG